MSPDRLSATSVAHKSTGGTLQSLPEPVDPVGDAPDYLTFKTVAPLRQSSKLDRLRAKSQAGSVRSTHRTLIADFFIFTKPRASTAPCRASRAVPAAGDRIPIAPRGRRLQTTRPSTA